MNLVSPTMHYVELKTHLIHFRPRRGAYDAPQTPSRTVRGVQGLPLPPPHSTYSFVVSISASSPPGKVYRIFIIDLWSHYTVSDSPGGASSNSEMSRPACYRRVVQYYICLDLCKNHAIIFYGFLDIREMYK